MKEITQLDEAELRHDMRKMYKREGPLVCRQALYEIIVAARILSEVMIEEAKGTSGME